MMKTAGPTVKNIPGLFLRFVRDDRGQSTTEYILMLAVVVMIAMKFKKEFLGRMQTIVGDLGTKIDGVVNDPGQ